MSDPKVYLEKLALFGRMLQKEGLTVSPAETADAGKILIALGFEDRNRVKAALRAIYAKTREEQTTFDRVFDGFFLSREAMEELAKKHQQEEACQEQQRQEAKEELQLNGSPMELSQEQREIYATIPQSQRQKLQQFMEKYKESSQRNPNLYNNFIHSVFTKAILEQQMRMDSAGADCMEMDPELGILYRDITKFRDTEIPKAISVIQTITRQLNGELSAKRRRHGHTGTLDFRRTIRKGLQTGGSLYQLSYRKKRSRRRHLVLLCDVSGSMMQFSEFALRFIQSLNQVAESSETFLFSQDLYQADPFSLQNMSLFRDYVKKSGLYGRGTDLGTALEKLMARRPCPLTGSTTLLILSDAKTIDQPRAVKALLEAKRLSGDVLWLNPIPASQWPYLNSVQTMSALCPMVSCSTLQALAAACRKLAVGNRG